MEFLACMEECINKYEKEKEKEEKEKKRTLRVYMVTCEY